MFKPDIVEGKYFPVYSVPPYKWLGGIMVGEGQDFPLTYGKTNYCYGPFYEMFAVAYPIPVNFFVSFYLKAWYFLRNGAKFSKPALDWRLGYQQGWSDHKNKKANKMNVYDVKRENSQFSTKKGL